jgi:GAF domain-containing protein
MRRKFWRVSAETLGQHRSAVPFALLYDYRSSEHAAVLASLSAEIGDNLHPASVDCNNSESLWPFQRALMDDGRIVEIGECAAAVSIPGWASPPRKAAAVPIRLRKRSEATGFMVLGIHPGRVFDDAYREFARRLAEQVAIALARARAYDQERRRAEALAEINRAKTAFFSNVSHAFRTPLTLMLGQLEEVLPEARERGIREVRASHSSASRKRRYCWTRTRCESRPTERRRHRPRMCDRPKRTSDMRFALSARLED